MAEKPEKRRSMSPISEPTSSKRIKTQPASSTSGFPIPGVVVVKPEPEDGEIAAHGGGGAPLARAAAAGQTNDADAVVERPRIDLSMEVELLHCAVADCNLPLRPPVFECKAGHLMCSTCRSGAGEGHCRRCGGVTTFAHCSAVDAYVGAARVPCPYKAYGCDSSVVYHDATAHRSACAHAPCRCAEPGCLFMSSPALLREHLAADHSWRVERVPGYGKPHTLRVAASEPHVILAVDGCW
ncbi:hypothetical protein ACP4OV_007096 [Aristida adscensionis]